MNRRYFLAKLAALSAIASTTPSFAKAEFGYFDGDVVVRWTFGKSIPARGMQLLEKFAYIDATAKRWEAQKGYIVDGASIPRIFWTLVGSPFVGRYRRASVVHDYYCTVKTEPWEDVHEMFYNACRAGGVPEGKAKLLYAAVYARGPRWPEPTRTVTRRAAKKKAAAKVRLKASTPTPEFLTSPPKEDQPQLQEFLDWAEENSPSLEEIKTRADAIFDR